MDAVVRSASALAAVPTGRCRRRRSTKSGPARSAGLSGRSPERSLRSGRSTPRHCSAAGDRPSMHSLGEGRIHVAAISDPDGATPAGDGGGANLSQQADPTDRNLRAGRWRRFRGPRDRAAAERGAGPNRRRGQSCRRQWRCRRRRRGQKQHPTAIPCCLVPRARFRSRRISANRCLSIRSRILCPSRWSPPAPSW